MAIFAYLRKSKDSSDLDNQRHIISQYCQNNNFTTPQYFEELVSGNTDVEERKQLFSLIGKLKREDVLIVADVSRVGRRTLDVMEVGAKVMKAKARMIFVENGLELKDDIGSEVTFFALSLGARISREMISSKTKTALSAKKANGVKLGRSFGSTSKILNENIDQVREYREKLGLSFEQIADIYKVSRQTVSTFCDAQKIGKKQNFALAN